MLLVGIDIVALSLFGVILMVLSYIVSCAVGLSQDEGNVCMTTTVVVVVAMTLFYVAMTCVLNSLLPV